MTTATAQAPLYQTKGDLFTSFDVADFPVPHGRDEVWRFTPLRRLRGLHNATAGRNGDGTATGTVSHEVTDLPGVTVETVGRDDARLGSTGAPVDRVSAQAYTGFEQATVVSIAADSAIAEPITITSTGPGVDELAYDHLLIEVGAHASAVIIHDQRGSGVIADNIEFSVGDGASLKVVSIQDFADDAVYLSNHHLRCGRDATIRHTVVSIGGEIVRLVPQVRYDGPGGDVELLGLYFADDGQHFEQRLLVDHSVPNCRSNVLYKGALQGDPSSDLPDAHTVWVGDVLIRAAAEGTDTYEVNRNLVLTDGARADSIPNLEIETGLIAGAGHASATGRFDDEQVFYMQSRGIPEDEARRLIVRAFFNEVIMKLDIAEVRQRLEDVVTVELERSAI